MITIIGNGSSALGKGLGGDLDKMSLIVRLNKFELKGFEKDLGSSTDLHILNSQALIPYAEKKTPPCSDVRFFRHGQDNPDTFFREIDMRFKHLCKTMLGGTRASIGFVAIIYALTSLSQADEQVAYLNFDWGKTGHYWEKNHRHSPVHDMKKEKEFLHQLGKEMKGRLIQL